MPLTEPVGAIWLLIMIGLIYWSLKREWKFVSTLSVPTFLIFLAGSTPLAESLVAAEERAWAQPSPTGSADAILVLGGGYYKSDHDPFTVALTGGASRIVAGVELARAGVSTNLLLGGSWPTRGETRPTTAKVEHWLETWQLPGVKIRNLGFAVNTYQEGAAFKKLRAEHGWDTVYLVTSALHMRRSVAVFKKQGIAVTPVACDYQAHGTTPVPFSLFPSRTNLNMMSLYLHEVIGRIVYFARGWI